MRRRKIWYNITLVTLINCACGCNAEEKSKALVYCSKATHHQNILLQGYSRKRPAKANR